MNHRSQRKTPEVHPHVQTAKDWLLLMSPRAGI